MPGKIDNYQFGLGGVNVSKGPLHLGDDEATQLQNAEIVPDSNTGGQGVLSKRGGLAALTSALAGSVTGLVGLPLQTTYTRTLWAGLATQDSDTWLKTSNGTTWTSQTTPVRPDDQLNTNFNQYLGDRRIASYKTFIVYPSNAHTTDFVTPANNTAPPIEIWNGTTDSELTKIPTGSSSGTAGNQAFGVLDMLVQDDAIYLSVYDPPNSGGNDRNGRVLRLDLTTGVLSQIASAFGAGTGEMAGGAPACLAWYHGKLWVGLDPNSGTSSAGKVVWAYPGISTTWTEDVSNLQGYPRSLLPYRGDLFVGLRGNASFDAAVFRRVSSTGLWGVSDTTVTSGTDYYGSLVEYSNDLYAVVFSDGGADVELIRKFDGTSWTTDRDVATTDGAGTAYPVGNAVLYGSDLYYAFESPASVPGTGFILRKSGGTWTKVATDDISGHMAVLTERT